MLSHNLSSRIYGSYDLESNNILLLILHHFDPDSWNTYEPEPTSNVT